jgi:hypothetical protein
MFNKEKLSAWPFIQDICESNPDAKKWIEKLKAREYPARDYPGKIECLGPSDPTEQHAQHIKGVDILTKLEAAYYSVRRPLEELILAKLGLQAQPYPGIAWVLGPSTGIIELQGRGKSVYQYLYSNIKHFESVGDETCFIAAHRFCDKHEENYVEWVDRTTGRFMYYANTGAYFDRAKSMQFDHTKYIPPIHGVYGFVDPT